MLFNYSVRDLLLDTPHSGQNSQKAGHNSLISLFRDEYSHSGVFGIADYESDICFPKNKMADTKWRAMDTNFDYLTKEHDSRVFGVADHESDTGLSKTEWYFQNGVFKMADDFRGFIFLFFILSVFGVADYESDIGFSNQEIADRKWR